MQETVIQSSNKPGEIYEPMSLPHHSSSAMTPELDPAYCKRCRLESLRLQQGNQNVIVVDIDPAYEQHN